MKASSRALLAGVLLLVTAPAFAVYKCEAGGMVSYSDAPCSEGKLLDIAPSAGDAKDTQQRLAREKAELTRLENERHKREAKEAQAQLRADRVRASYDKKCSALARRVKWAREDAASATGKSAEKTKRRARRAQEQYEGDCGK